MNTLRVFLAIVFAAIPLSRVLAQECTTNNTINPVDPNNPIILTVSSQEELDEAISGCTTLIGDIELSSNYAGPFALNGVVNVTGRIYMEYAMIPVYTPPPNIITSFEMLDVFYMEALFLVDVPVVRLPKVEVMLYLGMQSLAGGEIDFGTLKVVEATWFEGPYDSVTLPSLQSVDTGFVVCSEPDCVVDFEADPETLPTTEVILPVLETANFMGFNGSFSNFSCPKLHTIGRDELTAFGSGFSLMFHRNESLDFSFNPLHTLYGSLYAKGDISSINLSPLTETTASIYIETFSQARISGNLESASSIDIHGEIEEAWFPYLKTVDSLNITSTEHIGCFDWINDIHNSDAKTYGDIESYCGPKDPPTPTPSYYPTDQTDYSRDDDESSNRLTHAQVGAVVASVVVVVVLAAAIGCVWRHKVKKRRAAEANKDLPAYGNDGPPPPYSKEAPVLDPVAAPPPVAFVEGRG